MIPSASWISLAGSSFEHPDVTLEEKAHGFFMFHLFVYRKPSEAGVTSC
jgi:hypothetical protein